MFARMRDPIALCNLLHPQRVSPSCSSITSSTLMMFLTSFSSSSMPLLLLLLLYAPLSPPLCLSCSSSSLSSSSSPLPISQFLRSRLGGFCSQNKAPLCPPPPPPPPSVQSFGSLP
ncbi:unnamed protein product [Gadus morhua 'NCC']